MKTLTLKKKVTLTKKNVSKLGKKAQPKGDGRANPAPLDESKRAKFVGEQKIPRVSKGVAQQVTGSAVTRADGEVAAYRESLNGVAKTAVIRWLAAKGYDRKRSERIIAALFDMMTSGVFAKNWAKGEAGEGVPNLDPASVAVLRGIK